MPKIIKKKVGRKPNPDKNGCKKCKGRINHSNLSIAASNCPGCLSALL